MKLGSSSHSNENLTGITLGKMVSLVKVLGIYFSLDINVKEEMNYKEILSKIKKTVRVVEATGFNTFWENSIG